MGVLAGCDLRDDVRKGEMNDAIYAADFGDLLRDQAPSVYSDARTFFQNTHPAKRLRELVEAVFQRLADAGQPGTALRLSTGFGGGKTHTLMALWHLAENIGDVTLGTELLPAAGRPKKVTVVGVDLAKAAIPTFASHGAVQVHSLWGELFFKLGGSEALAGLGTADDPEASPNETQIEQALPAGPVLILLDEVVIYMARLTEQGQKNLLGFLNSLASVVSKRPQSVLIVTDPAAQAAYAAQAARLTEELDKVSSAANDLNEVFSRKLNDFDPIGGEAARVIVRRLFRSVSSEAAQKASAEYHALYTRLHNEMPGAIPPAAATLAYAQRIEECYPFHPRLIETAQDRLGPLPRFQRSRGVLRMFARIIRTVWEEELDLPLITAGDVDWSAERIQQDLLQRLGHDAFRSAISADVEKHAGELDGGISRGIHQRVASALLLESLPLGQSGLDKAELSLAVLRPDDAGHEAAEAIDRLSGVCWHTYALSGNRGWQFRYDPNIIKQIEEGAANVSREEAKSRVLSEIQGYFGGPAFRLRSWPARAKQIPDSAELQLALCETEAIASSVCANCDDDDPMKPVPRAFQNAIVVVTATPPALNNAIERAQHLMAAEALEAEHRKSGESGRMARDQLQRVKPTYDKGFRLDARRAFDQVYLASGRVTSLGEKFQVDEEQVLQAPSGQKNLRRFLDDRKLIYQESDALDVDLFMNEILPGATPALGQPGAFTAKAVHERFLGAPKLRLLPDGSVVRKTIVNAVTAGRVVVKTQDGRAYDDKGYVFGPEGARRRVTGATAAFPQAFPLTDEVLIIRADSESGQRSVKEDSETYTHGGNGSPPPPPPPPPPTSGVTATTWETAIEYAATRPLLTLSLRGTTPNVADLLATLAQPLGALNLTLSVGVSGTLKDGGSVNFAANGVKLNHPVKPLAAAKVLHNAVGTGASFEAELVLDFGSGGRADMRQALEDLAERAPQELTIRAAFDKPAGGAL